MAHAIRYLIHGFASEVARFRRAPRGNQGHGLPNRAPFKRLNLFLFGALAHLAFLGTVAAQAPRAAEQAGRFTVFSARAISDLSFVPRSAAPKQKLVFYPTARSPRCEFRSAMPLRFYDDTTGAVVAEAVIPQEVKDALLLFSPVEPAPVSGLRYRIAVLDEAGLRGGPNALTIINLSGLALTGTVGKESVSLEPGLNAPIPVTSAARLVLRTSIKGRSVQAYADTVQVRKNERALLILFPPFYQGSPEVQSRLLVDASLAVPTTPPAKKK